MAIRKVTDRSSTITIPTVGSTEISDDANTSTGALDIPAGTTAERPASPTTGNIRFNTTLQLMEFWDGSAWVTTNPITEIDSISGNIWYNLASQLDINFTDSSLSRSGNTVTFKSGSTTIATVTNQTITSGVMTDVSVPSAVYTGYSAGNTISITVTTDGGLETNAVTKTILTPATGGDTVVTSSDGTYRYHAFTQGGTFNSEGVTSIEYLVVAGGGGGGGSTTTTNVGNGGGGGAGGLLNNTVSINANTSFTIVVGPGGNADVTGLPGSNSSISGTGLVTITALGGGGGGYYPSVNGDDGGSGGGGGYSVLGGSGTGGQGNDGGDAVGQLCGGGGGAGEAGENGNTTPNQAGNGGDGLQFSHWATATSTGDNGYYAGGGGGGGTNFNGSFPGGLGGLGGGADSNYNQNGGSVNTTPTAAQANTGGGGGGRSITNSSGSGGAGGSGIVIIRYALT